MPIFSGSNASEHVYPRGEANVSSETIRHDCIQMSYIY